MKFDKIPVLKREKLDTKDVSQKDRQTDRYIFSKSKSFSRHRKTFKSKTFHDFNTFFFSIQEKVKILKKWVVYSATGLFLIYMTRLFPSD